MPPLFLINICRAKFICMSREPDVVSHWLVNAARYPLLPKEEALRLGKIIQDPKSSEPRRKRAIEKLVVHNLRLVPNVARKFCRLQRAYSYRDAHMIDLLQMGVFGLKRAAEKYDPSRGYAFSTYAIPWIRQSINRYALANISPIRVPESTLRDISKMSTDLDQAKPDDMSDAKWYRVSDAFLALHCNSIDAPMSGREDVDNYHETIASTVHHYEQPEMTFDQIVEGVSIDENAKQMLYKRFMQSSGFVEIGEDMGVSPNTVKRSIRRSLFLIRKQKMDKLKC